ncbi:hypothetical protein T01_8037 [Trichinella spiralis]|uniref:Uncharacterized protein n=1 Tax=Trichinella spiralis TaxID=6334 RepID=A0A0V1AUV9_TRISP|nr:hypothetical protein T01_8037 [Trichinella spiralis]
MNEFLFINLQIQRIHYNVYRRGDFIQFLNGLHKPAYFPVLLSGASADFTFLRCKSSNLCMKIEFQANFVCILKLSFLPDAALGTSKLDSNEDAAARAVRKLLCGISGGCFLVTAPDPWNEGTLRIDMISGQGFLLPVYCIFFRVVRQNRVT